MGYKTDFLEEIRENIVIGDGAIGTELFSRGAPQETGIERLNILHPEMVLKLHQDYVAAGSRVIETNTFGANRLNLARYNAGEDLQEIIRSGVNLALKAAKGKAWVAGSIGPLPYNEGVPLSPEEQIVLFNEQIEMLLEGGVDILIFETFIELEQLVNAVKYAKSLCSLPIVAQMAFDSNGLTAGGDSAVSFVTRCREAGADVIGANCGGGIHLIEDAVSAITQFGFPSSAYMNAGFGEFVEGRRLYLAPPEYLAEKAVQLTKKGVRLIGGCCGTGPETIRAIAKALSDGETVSSPSIATPVLLETLPEEKTTEIYPPAPGILVELDTPKKPDISKLLDAARTLKREGVLAVTLADNPLASVRADVITTAGIVARETGIDVIPHLTGRDRNRIALQSAIMGAHLLGIRSILCVTGDPIRMYNETNTTGVFDLTSIGLVKLVREFNMGRKFDGRMNTNFSIGVALNPNVRGIDAQVSRLSQKIQAGAHFALTQPLFELDRLDNLQSSMDSQGINLPVFVGVMPLTSSRQADFLHYEVPGISIPEKMRTALSKYVHPGDHLKAGQDIAVELVEKMKDRVYGFYFITSVFNADNLLPLIKTSGKSLNPQA